MKKSDLLFYEIMNYPIPQNKEYFKTEKSNEEVQSENNKFSREEKNPFLDDFLKNIAKHKNIFQSLPWIKNIYLCNSITFNKLHEGSDIDLFIVAKEGCLWRARFASTLIFFFLGLKRSKTKIKQKYCLSFYITEQAQNLYNISLPKTDIYLVYRLAHLVPLYQYQKEDKNIYDYNSWIFTILPNLPQKHNINIGNELYEGNSKIKNLVEKYIGGFFGYIIEYIIKIIRIPILMYKTNKLKEIGKDIIFNNSMLKFHQDKRQKISLLYRTKKNQYPTKQNHG